MTPEKEPTTFCPASPQHWREWLQAHHAEKQSVWLIYHKKKSAAPSLTWSQAVDEALCFGWIDSQAQPLDDERYRQFFSRRKPSSGWSKINKAKIERLIAAGLMAPAGLTSIETAKQNGAWTLLDEVEELHLPADLAQPLQGRPLAASYFERLSRTDKRNILQWLVLAKRPDTRQKRIAEIVDLAAQQLKPVQFRSRPSSR
jgi:uncharacterized protein YdeI (YjbR/CyaY-like superfamily)